MAVVTCDLCGLECQNVASLGSHKHYRHAAKPAPDAQGSDVEHQIEKLKKLRAQRHLRALEENEILALELENKRMRDELIGRAAPPQQPAQASSAPPWAERLLGAFEAAEGAEDDEDDDGGFDLEDEILKAARDWLKAQISPGSNIPPPQPNLGSYSALENGQPSLLPAAPSSHPDQTEVNDYDAERDDGAGDEVAGVVPEEPAPPDAVTDGNPDRTQEEVLT